MTYSNLQIFTVELVGTFILVVFATGSIVYDAEFFDGQLGIPFAAVAPFIALLIGVYSFGKISLAHFNPAVTIGYYITGHISKIQIVYYFTAEIIGAILGSLFVLTFIGNKANLGANAPNPDFSIFVIFPVEVFSFCNAHGRNILCCIYKRFERIQWCCNWWNSWIGHFVFGLYLWSFNESCKSTSPCIIIWNF